MEQTLVYFVSTLALLLLFKLFFLDRKWSKNRPPSPPSLPIIGHIHLLKEPIHRSLQHLSNKYGPVISLSFGNRDILLVSSPALAEECFSKNDIVFANRPQLPSAKHLNYDYTTLACSSYGEHWRNLRRIASTETFSTIQLNAFLSIRQDQVRILLRDLYKISDRNFAKVEMKSRLSALSCNIIMRMVTGKQYFGAEAKDAEEAKRFRHIIEEMFEISGASNLGVFVPILKWMDFNGMGKRMSKIFKESDEFFQTLVNEHRNKQRYLESGGSKMMIDTILSLQESEPERYSDDIIKGMIMIMIAAGTDTTAVTIEWAMSLLLNNSGVLKKARAEIDSVIGNERLVVESDCSKLPYLQHIVKETFRLYPAAPLLLPHLNSADCNIGGYHVSKDTILFVNAYAIHRDPEIWADATSFRPERFEGVEVEAYQLMPFGVGRRSCPGSGLANRVVSLTLAALIQCFEWERSSEEAVDMTEGTGLTMPKAKPLEALRRARPSMLNALNAL